MTASVVRYRPDEKCTRARRRRHHPRRVWRGQCMPVAFHFRRFRAGGNIYDARRFDAHFL